MSQYTSRGFSVIYGLGLNHFNNTSWYLDNTGVDWRGVYQSEPCAGASAEQCDLVLGGEGQMWGEMVDGSDLQQTVWPRLAVMGEKLWSPRAATEDPEANAAHSRLLVFRCLLLRRGVRAAPVDNAAARMPPSGPGSCYQ